MNAPTNEARPKYDVVWTGRKGPQSWAIRKHARAIAYVANMDDVDAAIAAYEARQGGAA